MQIPSQDNIRAVMRQKGYPIFTGPWNPTLFGLRAWPGALDAFDDVIGVLYETDAGKLCVHAGAATLDPGKPSVQHPKRPDGTAQMVETLHRGAFTFGMHHPGTPGAYECLVPRRPIEVMRYKNEADFIAVKGTPSTSTTTQIHHASAVRESTVVGPWSEGCGVYSAAVHLKQLLSILHRGEGRWGKVFSFALMSWQA